MKLLTLGLSALLSLTASSAFAEKAFTTKKLDSGLELIAMESHKVPLVTIVLAVKAGGMTETPETRGLTHLWEHMFFKGNKRIPNQEAFNKRIRQLGIVYNGDTSAELVRYYFTLPSAFLDEGLQFMADAISTPLLEQVELEKERRVVLNEYERSEAQPSFDYRNLERKLIYGSEDYLRDPLGIRAVIENASREQLYKIKDEVMVPSNSALLVSGDFVPAELEKMVAKHFKDWANPKDWKPVVRPGFQKFPDNVNLVMTRANVQNAAIQFTFQGPKAKTDVADSFAADVLVNLLEHTNGKFYKKYVDSGLTFDAGFSYYTQSQAGELEVGATAKAEDATKVQKMLLEEINEWVKDDYFTEDQLEDVRRNLLINHKRELNAPSSYIKSLAFWWGVTGLEYYDGYLDSLRKTGLPEVRAFVQKWLVGKPSIAGILLSPQDAKAAGLKDTAQPMVDKYLGDYKVAPKASLPAPATKG
jgi:zinc protease